ncbi:MAG: hypothetical protein IPQ02_02590 [Saprospiraceae bacterium]|nr:hypothetical protein [Candidatus Defluviibacterium haderslevense]
MLEIKENRIIQTIGDQKKEWSIQELLEIPDPLSGEPLEPRNAAMFKVVEMAEVLYNELSKTALLRYDFWKQFKPDRIVEQKFQYTTKVTHTYQWELTIDSKGLHYKDISGDYTPQLGAVTDQLFSDFWFYGPLLPIPDLSLRKLLVATIRNAFIQAGSAASYKHFELFEYPEVNDSNHYWQNGDYEASDFVCVRYYGIEIGATNWRDGLAYQWFLSFEYFLTKPYQEDTVLTPEIRAEIELLLGRKSTQKRLEDITNPEKNAESKRLFMDNGGQIHYIHLHGFGDDYKATYSEEAAWRAELIEQYIKRLSEEENEFTLIHIAKGLELNGVKNVGELIFTATKSANPKGRQALTKILIDQYDAELGAVALISLLEYERFTDYWRNYVFNSLFKLRNNKTVQHFIIEKLKGDYKTHFEKSVDVLRAWNYRGDEDQLDRNLLNELNWDDATAHDPNFRSALDKTIKIIQKK